MIFFKKQKLITVDNMQQVIDIKSVINSALFPGIQGGPHNKKISSKTSQY